MDASTRSWQLKELVIRYSETGGSSLGVRFFLRHLLPSWKSENSAVSVRTEHSLYQHPRVVAQWKSGESTEASLRNLTPKQITDLIELYRDSHGPNLHLRHGGPRCWTTQRSIQGLWQPSLDLALKQLTRVFSDKPRNQPLRFSAASVSLARQHLTGKGGRWGPETAARPVGFDMLWLRRVFARPL